MPFGSLRHLPTPDEQTGKHNNDRRNAQQMREATKARSNIWFIHGWMLTKTVTSDK